MRKFFLYATAAVVAVGTTAGFGEAAGASRTGGSAENVAAQSSSSTAGSATEYVVLYSQGGNVAAVKDAVVAAGGTLVSQNEKLGYAVARSSSAAFATNVDKSAVVLGAARNRVIGAAPKLQRARSSEIERLDSERRAAGRSPAATAKAPTSLPATPLAEPLANRQWDMRQIGATPAGSYARQPGKAGVLVGVIDTGIDGTHPDIAPNFDAAQSRNFVTDIPSIDGPCEVASCVDPANVDDDGHGTHVASTIASPINGLGIAGVAPKVTLVNIRAGQDSGYFFLASTLAALTYAGDIGVDVVNMSFYTDPWLFNCTDNPADSPAERAEQRVVREATQRAVNYARGHGVLPTRKAYYSNFGTEQTEVAAPGGDVYDTPDNTSDPRNIIFAAYPAGLAASNGDLNDDGTPNNDFVVRDCRGSVCGYYQYLQGTSMAAPHAVGVAALIVSEFGKTDRRLGGLTLAPADTARRLADSAIEHACPAPRLFPYTRINAAGTVFESDALCSGPKEANGFYGAGIVNAYAAVTSRR